MSTAGTVKLGEQPARSIMGAGGAIFGLAALALLLAPGRFAQVLGLVNTDSLSWSLRMTGLCLIPLVYVLFVVRGSMPDTVVRAFATLMAVVSLMLGVVTLTAPGAATAGRWAFSLIGFGFAVAYGWALLRYKLKGPARNSPRSRKPRR